ncbi:MAG TPA: hypothetical protein VGO45_08265 [Bacteroidia bacterium]|jgi:hypothetical protein|nr:hypothetical protein [Bacteroidia bacterium]
MKTSVFIWLLLITKAGFSQLHPHHELETAKYAGVYSYGENPNTGATGSVTIYPETDSTVLFFIDICKGPPSYNLGQCYARLKFKNGNGIYYTKDDYEKKGCMWDLTINNKLLIIKTLDGCHECGFGAGVIADNQYALRKDSIPAFFKNGEGTKVFFSKTSPDSYRGEH